MVLQLWAETVYQLPYLVCSRMLRHVTLHSRLPNSILNVILFSTRLMNLVPTRYSTSIICSNNIQGITQAHWINILHLPFIYPLGASMPSHFLFYLLLCIAKLIALLCHITHQETPGIRLSGTVSAEQTCSSRCYLKKAGEKGEVCKELIERWD